MTSNLNRFVDAQSSLFQAALAELKSGRKRSHWMWFIFPQIHGLGQSEKSKKYAISSLKEAKEYLDHPLLGPRLEQATRAVLAGGSHPREVLGDLDYTKFISCMTLFDIASPSNSIYALALQKLSTTDNKTKEILGENYDDLREG